MPQVGSTQIGLTEISLTQIGVDLRMLSSSLIPPGGSLLEKSEVLLICHRVSFLFGCRSHYQGLTPQPALVRLDQEGCFLAFESRVSEGMILGSQR